MHIAVSASIRILHRISLSKDGIDLRHGQANNRKETKIVGRRAAKTGGIKLKEEKFHNQGRRPGQSQAPSSGHPEYADADGDCILDVD